MSDLREALDRLEPLYEPPEQPYEGLLRRRDRKERNRRISAGALAIIFAIVSFAALTGAFRGAGPASEPMPPGIFSEVGGWITYGYSDGIWAVDPSDPRPDARVQLSPKEGIPLAWSSDGSRLLISRDEPAADERGLFVLNADGTETRLVGDVVTGASFSRDGTTVIFAPEADPHATLEPSIYRIDADGGEPTLLLESNRDAWLYFPTFSPDGTQIAYFDGSGDGNQSLLDASGDGSHSLRVVNADGSGLRVLIDNISGYRISGLAWSPDGTRLAFGRRMSYGIYTIRVDGSGLRLVIPDGGDPQWSPDGSRISFGGEAPDDLAGLLIADRDGAHVQELEFSPVASGPWNPLTQTEPEAAAVPAASEGLTQASLLLPLAALMILVGGVFVIRRRRGHETGKAV